MPIIRDHKGQVYAIPAAELAKYLVTEEQARRLLPQSGRDDDDVELQSAPMAAGSHQWYAGD